MKNDVAISVSHISKNFKLPHDQQNSIKGMLINFRKRGYEVQRALKDVSFEVKKGEFFGIVGRNGSGKSTLLKLLAGIYTPDGGTIKVNGKLTPFIELGVGFNPELSGRDNVFLNGALLGFNRKEMSEMYNEIVEFAELERFMDQKLKNYSSGMQVRLAFSIAIRAQSDVLILDEVLAVGDTNFQRKCFEVFKEIKKSGRTVVLVTHDMGSVRNFCDRALLLQEGRAQSIGSSSSIAKLYNQRNIESFSQEVGQTKNPDHEYEQYKPAKLLKTEIVNLAGDYKKGAYSPKEKIVIDVSCKFNEKIESPIIGITIKESSGLRLFDANTQVAKIKTGVCDKGSAMCVRFVIDNIFSDGKYIVQSAIASQDAVIFYDINDDAALFTTGGWDFPSAIVQPKHSVKLIDKGEKI